MKLSVLFLICSLSMTYAAESYAQKTMISLEVRNETVGTVLEKLKKESGFDFFFNNKHVDLKRIVSVSANNNNIFKILDQIFAGTNVKYSVLEKKIILSTEIVQGIQQEQNKVTGIVKDANGEPIIGANVIVKGQSTGTITDIDGRFVLDTPKDAVLQITYIGYVSQEVKVSGKKELNVVLKEDTETLEEVVVVGYGVQKKANLTGAVSSVKMDEILGDRPVTSVSNVLMGAMPGLQVTGTSGQPGAEMSFNIRGVNSINEGAPLVLVDNVEMDINMLDPNDIESISVLKDAASSAIYGARAAFGVILVTTKKGMKDTRFSINYSNNFSFSKPSNLPHKATPLQTVQAYKDMGTVSYQTGQNVDTWLELLKEYNTNSSNYPDGYAVVDGLRYSLQETDLLNDMMETGFQQTHNISVGGGNKSISYRMSAGMVNQNGILVTDKDSYKRYNISSYIRSDIHSWITPELDIKYANSHSELPYTSASYGIWGAAVAFPSYFPLGNMELDGEILPINTPHNFINLSAPKENDRNDLRIFGKLTITPFKDLKIIGEYTFNRKTH
jgi:TonB-linked SusC/RagA family outer membrane protein